MLKLRVDYVNFGIVINKEGTIRVWALGKEPRHKVLYNKLLWFTLIQYSCYTQVVCVSQLYTIESTLYSIYRLYLDVGMCFLLFVVSTFCHSEQNVDKLLCLTKLAKNNQGDLVC